MDAPVADMPISREPRVSTPDDPAAVAANALHRAHLYHFLELALAHPGEDGYEYFRSDAAETGFLAALNALPSAAGIRAEGATAAGAFFAALRQQTFEDLEAGHIGLFSANFPHLPCPPYGSLFTADGDKRLEEMLAIKKFYQDNGVDIADAFDELPDHVCAELEFLHLLCFREHDAALKGDGEVVAGVRLAQARFLDRFILPFAARLVELARAEAPNSPYSHLLEATRCVLTQHRAELG
jgi:TorA maturation chaperone TorD